MFWKQTSTRCWIAEVTGPVCRKYVPDMTHLKRKTNGRKRCRVNSARSRKPQLAVEGKIISVLHLHLVQNWVLFQHFYSKIALCVHETRMLIGIIPVWSKFQIEFGSSGICTARKFIATAIAVVQTNWCKSTSIPIFSLSNNFNYLHLIKVNFVVTFIVSCYIWICWGKTLPLFTRQHQFLNV